MELTLGPLDAVVTALEHHRVLPEDSRIRVLETLIHPGDETRVHTHEWGGYRYDENRKVMIESKDLAMTPEAGTAIWVPPLPVIRYAM